MPRTILQVRQGMCLRVAEMLRDEFDLERHPRFDVDEAARLIDAALPHTLDEAEAQARELDVELANVPGRRAEKPSAMVRLREALDLPPDVGLKQCLEAAIERVERLDRVLGSLEDRRMQ